MWAGCSSVVMPTNADSENRGATVLNIKVEAFLTLWAIVSRDRCAAVPNTHLFCRKTTSLPFFPNTVLEKIGRRCIYHFQIAGWFRNAEVVGEVIFHKEGQFPRSAAPLVILGQLTIKCPLALLQCTVAPRAPVLQTRCTTAPITPSQQGWGSWRQPSPSRGSCGEMLKGHLNKGF